MNMTSNDTPALDISALEMGLKLLEKLSSAITPLSLLDLAEHLDLDRKTVMKVLEVLIRHDFVTYHPDKKTYSISRKLFDLSHHSIKI
jgi:DNA-binding IclR family transcriptional regulator